MAWRSGHSGSHSYQEALEDFDFRDSDALLWRWLDHVVSLNDLDGSSRHLRSGREALTPEEKAEWIAAAIWLSMFAAGAFILVCGIVAII